MRSAIWLGLACGCAGFVVATASADELRGSPDVALDPGGALGPAQVTADLTAGVPAPVDLGPLPDGANVTSYTTYGGYAFFSVDHTLSLPGGVTARPRDIVGWDGVSHTIALEGAALGIPDGAAFDAFWVDPGTGAFLLSFDTTLELLGTPVLDADVVDGALVPVFDSAAAGLPPGVDVDAVSGIPGSNVLLLSFDVGGTVGGVVFADEDVLAYDPGTKSWSLHLDTSTVDGAWERADLDALHLVPEAGRLPALVAGMALLAGLAGRRRRHTAGRCGAARDDVPDPRRRTITLLATLACVLVALCPVGPVRAGSRALDIGLAAGSSSAWRENTISSNSGGTVSAGVDLGANSCNATTSCP